MSYVRLMADLHISQGARHGHSIYLRRVPHAHHSHLDELPSDRMLNSTRPHNPTDFGKPFPLPWVVRLVILGKRYATRLRRRTTPWCPQRPPPPCNRTSDHCTRVPHPTRREQPPLWRVLEDGQDCCRPREAAINIMLHEPSGGEFVRAHDGLRSSEEGPLLCSACVPPRPVIHRSLGASAC